MRITDIDWVQTSMKRTKEAVHCVYEATIQDKTIQRKTVKIAFKAGGWHEEREWFVVDGFYFAKWIDVEYYLGKKRRYEEE